MAVVAPQGQPNQEENEQQQAGQQPQQLAGSQQSGQTPAGGRLASFSSGSAPGSQGSGRFTNLSKYIDANKGASENLGARANNTINKGFNQDQQKVSEANKSIADTYGQGRNTIDTQGTQYKNQLGQIGQNLGTFQSFDNRGQFDQAGTQAQSLAQDAAYKNLAAGTMIDQNALQNQQQMAQQQAQGLVQTAQTNLGNIQTDQGRNSLFNQVLAPKQGYSAGARNFDKLFLGGALGGIQQNLQGKIGEASQLAKTTNAFGNNVNQLVTDEENLLKDLSGQALTNQNLFNEKLNTQGNIDYVNQMRDKRYQDIVSGLQSGTVSQDVADQLGLSGLETFANTNQTAPTGQTQTQKNLVGTYNILKDPTAINNYFTQGKRAGSFQDIVGQQDFDAYKALQSLSGVDSGQLAGTSQLGSSIAATQGKSLDSLSKDIQAQDKTFIDDVAANKFAGVSNTVNGRQLTSSSATTQQALDAIKDLTSQGKYTTEQLTNNSLLPQYSGSSWYGNLLPYVQNNAATGWDYDHYGRDENRAKALLDATKNIGNAGAFNALEVTNQVDPLSQRFKGLL